MLIWSGENVHQTDDNLSTVHGTVIHRGYINRLPSCNFDSGANWRSPWEFGTHFLDRFVVGSDLSCVHVFGRWAERYLWTSICYHGRARAQYYRSGKYRLDLNMMIGLED